MNFTQNEKISQVKDTTLVVGIDISSETHYARAFDWRGLELAKVFKFESASYGFENFSEWLSELCKTNQKDNIIIGAEPTEHYWFTLAEYLKENSIKFVFVNPMHVKRTKELDDNHPSKNDRKDPKVIAKLVIEGRYLIPYIPEDIYAELRVMNESRMRINKELVAIKNRIQRWLAIYFPEYKNVFGNWASIMKELWNTMQIILAAVGGWLGYFLGGCDGLVYALLLFVAADYVTGVMCAVVDKRLSSEIF